MGRKLYVGNLGCAVARCDLENLFGDHGDVLRAGISTNPSTGRNQGCGFVEMSSDEEAEAAIAALNGAELDGRVISVRAAEERTTDVGGRTSGRDVR
jgi:cold-inducible RNA-binding protein